MGQRPQPTTLKLCLKGQLMTAARPTTDQFPGVYDDFLTQNLGCVWLLSVSVMKISLASVGKQYGI